MDLWRQGRGCLCACVPGRHVCVLCDESGKGRYADVIGWYGNLGYDYLRSTKHDPCLPASARTSYTRVDFARVQAQLTTNLPIPQTPRISLTSLLVSRHCKTQAFDPETIVGRVKELVWNAGSVVVSVCPLWNDCCARPALGSTPPPVRPQISKTNVCLPRCISGCCTWKRYIRMMVTKGNSRR